MVAKRPLPQHDSSSEQEKERENSQASQNRRRQRGLQRLQSLARTVSPPCSAKKVSRANDDLPHTKSVSAAIEAGEQTITDHVAFYSNHLLSALSSRSWPDPTSPRLNHSNWIDLYTRNAGSLKGSHFVVHQHDHPIAGTHYDLRLQCNPTSSISFAIMYGLPGDPNSRRLNRNATETRVHCLWNHLIETASHATGSMLIWDTGRYEVLPYSVEQGDGETTDGGEDSDEAVAVAGSGKKLQTEQEKLRQAFQRRKVKLRLHGTRLPGGYTLSLRLNKENDRVEQPRKPARRRRRKVIPPSAANDPSDSDSERPSSQDHPFKPPPLKRGLSSLSRLESPPQSPNRKKVDGYEAASTDAENENLAAVASDDEEEAIRAKNAYIGAVNDVGSIHQRKWFLSVDRISSGFTKQTCTSKAGFSEIQWTRRGTGGYERFVVGGREIERSVVTGRLAGDILKDEGVIGYVPRGLWRAINY
ncbi:hypothetical protein LTR05_000690 [Lithohypha guttulata]|uniref:DNA ligase D 3'-phosphoesterase domain-containing protein n=1 Tax=Lithohypha guttulata TaxID=1690604 RepID=A0AAN7T6E0_9EURO|nr:hypothetical protein LTR05_000690 [Lithohypha guttulata]